MTYQFQPCGLCGNCRFFQQSERADGFVIVPAGCKVNGEPVFIKKRSEQERGCWKCESFQNGREKKRRERKNKPWQRTLNRHERLSGAAMERRI